MLKIDIIKFEAQDVVTVSYPEVKPCGCVMECFDYLPDHASSCNCVNPNGDEHIVSVPNNP